MHRPVDLLVEQRVLHEPRDARIAADAELSDAARASSRSSISTGSPPATRRTRRRPDRPRSAGGAPHRAARVRRGELDERDRALGGVLHRREEELSAGQVRAARVDLRLTSFEAQLQVGLCSDDLHLLRGVEPLGVVAHPLALRVPVEETGAEQEVFVVPERHTRVLGERRRRIVAADPRHLVRVDAIEVRPEPGLEEPDPLRRNRPTPRGCSPARRSRSAHRRSPARAPRLPEASSAAPREPPSATRSRSRRRSDGSGRRRHAGRVATRSPRPGAARGATPRRAPASPARPRGRCR